MVYREERGDVFEYHDKGYTLVHCVSADFALGAGIAKEFDKRYNLRKDLLYRYGNKWWKEYDDSFGGDCIMHYKKNVIDLVTKTRYWYKPSLYTMERALKKLRSGCEFKDIKKLAMPKIGCGLDRLKWEDVSRLIKEIFADTDIEIVVCYL